MTAPETETKGRRLRIAEWVVGHAMWAVWMELVFAGWGIAQAVVSLIVFRHPEIAVAQAAAGAAFASAAFAFWALNRARGHINELTGLLDSMRALLSQQNVMQREMVDVINGRIPVRLQAMRLGPDGPEPDEVEVRVGPAKPKMN